VESTNYRTVKIPSDLDIPIFVKQKFPDFYKSMFEVAYQKENKKVLFTEYAWDMSWCDPCAAEPLKKEELKRLGVFWLDETNEKISSRPIISPINGPVNAYLTRLHVRYDRENFPEDLMFQETADSTTFQGKYIMNHPWTGASNCPLAKEYPSRVQDRRKKEAENLAKLTQWKMEDIQKEMGTWEPKEPEKSKSKKWFQNIFK
jgi:hypothetical protein